jgi:hypothetical protein
VKWIKRIFRPFIPAQKTVTPVPQPESLSISDPPPDENLHPTSPRPYFIRPVAHRPKSGHIPIHEAGAATHQNRDPRRALASLRQRPPGPGPRGREGAWAATDPGESLLGGLGIFPEISAQIFVEGTLHLEHRNGAEHNVFFDPSTGRVIKLTQPGEYGASGSLLDYVQRMAWANEFFQDDILFEGWLHYPNEEHPRLITSQPWYRVSPLRPEPTM